VAKGKTNHGNRHIECGGKGESMKTPTRKEVPESNSILEIAALDRDPALWLAMMLTKPGQKRPETVGEVHDIIKGLAKTAIAGAVRVRCRDLRRQNAALREALKDIGRERIMGTNYYLEPPPCPTCGHAKKILHVGKSECGWCFTLHVDPKNGIRDLPDWKKLWTVPGYVIKDEYGKVIDAAAMLAIITNREGFDIVQWSEPDYRDSYAEPGPNNLVRYKIDHVRGISHGRGTWDLVVGKFS
jgi:predicted Zn-ribbon and HTH transcriptional regulator